MPRTPRTAVPKQVGAFQHQDTRPNIPTAELQSLALQAEAKAPVPPLHLPRARPLPPGETRPRDADRDPQVVWNGMRLKLTHDQVRQLQETGEVELGDAQLVWRGKDAQDWSDLVVQPPPIYVQEKVHPRAIIADLARQSAERRAAAADAGPDLFADFNGLPDPEARLEFYQHAQHWTNRLILGDSLQVMASLAEREGLRGRVQCIYFDPPYGIKFNSNWQVNTQSRDVKDGKREDVSREPEQVRAFRDTWKDGIHSYLTYLRDRLTVARELLTESGSIFVQIGDENVHRVRAVLDEVFGQSNYVNTFIFKKKSSTLTTETVFDEIIWYAKSRDQLRVRTIFEKRDRPEDEAKFNTILMPGMYPVNVSKLSEDQINTLIEQDGKWARVNYPIVSQHPSAKRSEDYIYRSKRKTCGENKQWRFDVSDGMPRIERSGRLFDGGGASLGGVVLWDDWNQVGLSNIWSDVHGEKFPSYVVQTALTPVQRCILIATDPGDLVLDPTCGSGTTATVAEQWGRRWITIDTSRVALALARTRVMAGRYPFYLLADSREGRAKEASLTGRPAPDTSTAGDLRQGFVYERAPHVTLKSIANNAEIDVLWEAAQPGLEADRAALNRLLGTAWEEWQIPRDAAPAWPAEARALHASWWEKRIARQKAIDASIARKADVEYLYDRPYEDRAKVRVAGPFTVESLSPHRVVPSGEDELAEEVDAAGGRRTRGSTPPTDFAAMVLDHLRTAGVHQHAKDDSIHFTALHPWPGRYIGAEGRFTEGEAERRAGILIGPEYGTLSRPDLVAAAREASEAGFDVLIACAFNYDAHATELSRLGPLPILKARMNPDLHMAEDLKNTGRGNLFVVFGEPDVQLRVLPDGMLEVQVHGVNVFDPQTGAVRTGGTDSIAAWFIDTAYNEESFFVRHAYFLGAQDPYKSLKTALRAEVDEDAWATLYRDTSRPFPRPDTGRIAVKVINHFGDEVMKVMAV